MRRWFRMSRTPNDARARQYRSAYEHDRMVMLFSMMDGGREVSLRRQQLRRWTIWSAVSRTAPERARRAVPPIARPDRTMRVAQIRGPGIRGHASRHHPAQHRFSQLMAEAATRRIIDGAVASAGVDVCLDWQARGEANISRACGTLHPQRRCQPIPKRSGIVDPSQSASDIVESLSALAMFPASGSASSRGAPGHGAPLNRISCPPESLPPSARRARR